MCVPWLINLTLQVTLWTNTLQPTPRGGPESLRCNALFGGRVALVAILRCTVLALVVSLSLSLSLF